MKGKNKTDPVLRVVGDHSVAKIIEKRFWLVVEKSW
jgi:hypothetical protein